MQCSLPLHGFPGLGSKIKDDLRHELQNPGMKYTADCQCVVSQVWDLKSRMIWGMRSDIQAWNTLQTANLWFPRSWIANRGWSEAWDVKSKLEIHCRLPICGFLGLGLQIGDDLRHGMWNPSLKYTADCQSVVSQVLDLKLRMIWGMSSNIRAWNTLQTANLWFPRSWI